MYCYIDWLWSVGLASFNAQNVSCPPQFAAQQLHQDAKQWEEKDNNMVAAAKKMAKLMLQMSKFAKCVHFF